MKNKPNREYKSTLFTYMLSQKEYALQLYNALNNSNYDNPDDITVTTLENVVFINRYNDVSFLFNSTLNLYEHQSTYNPNIPLRSLFYLSQTYEQLYSSQKIYGSGLVHIPTPKCVVFYNGAKDVNDRITLKLSDAFANKEVQGDLELSVLMINVNYGHNKELMTKSEVLYGYSLYISKFREYNESGTMSRTDAAIKALDYCIEADVMKEFFAKRRNEVVGMILEEYTTEHVEKYIEEIKAENAEQKKQLEMDAKIIADNQTVIADKEAIIALKEAEIASLKKRLQEKN